MRRRNREVTDLEKIKRLIKSCEVMRLAIHDEPFPYLVPVNFGYEWQAEHVTFYFHGAASGKKIALLQQNPKVAVELDGKHQLIDGGDKGCNYSYAYQSLIGFGTVELLENPTEKIHGLNRLMAQVAKAEYEPFPEKMLAKTSVGKIVLESFTVKENPRR